MLYCWEPCSLASTASVRSCNATTQPMMQNRRRKSMLHADKDIVRAHDMLFIMGDLNAKIEFDNVGRGLKMGSLLVA